MVPRAILFLSMLKGGVFLTLKIIDMTEATSADEFTFAVWHQDWQKFIYSEIEQTRIWTIKEWEKSILDDDFKQQVRDLLPKRISNAHLSRKQFQMATVHENVTGDWVDDPEELDRLLKDWNPSKREVVP